MLESFSYRVFGYTGETIYVAVRLARTTTVSVTGFLVILVKLYPATRRCPVCQFQLQGFWLYW